MIHQLTPPYYSFSPNNPQHFNSTDDQFSDENPIKKPTIKICKYKTQMCKNYSEMGYCPYWEKCQFAHGLQDLCFKDPPTKKYYRTKKCRPFWEKGNCNYGFRCQFSHYECSSAAKKGKEFLLLGKQLLQASENKEGSRLLQILRREQ